MSGQVTRKHHYVPRFYLSNFTSAGSRSGLIYHFEAGRRKPVSRSPRNVAWDLDFYAVDVPGEALDVAERLFSRIEDRGARAVRLVLDQGILPQGDDFDDLIAFLALMYTRGPRWRSAVTGFYEQMAAMNLRIATSTQERWESVISAMQRDGAFPDGAPDYQTMRRYSDEYGDQVRVANPSVVHVQAVLNGLQFLPEELKKRAWSLLVSETDAPDLVCSDCPATLVWTAPGLDELSPPGLGYRDTEVALPLGRRSVLVGRLDGASEVRAVGRDAIIEINRRTAGNALRHVYCATEDFVFLDGGGREAHASDWFAGRR